MFSQISKTERRVIFMSISVMATFMGLLGWAAWRYGVEVPACVPEMQPFETGKVVKRSDYDYEVHIVAKMWAFEPAIINLPKNSKVRIYLSSKDVVHGFHLEKSNVNLMAVPGTVNYAETTLKESGPYRIVCHEYCGSGHQNMASVINVTDEIPAETVPQALAAEEDNPGSQHIQTYGCVACHTTDGSPGVGPTFKGLYGRTEQFTDGTELVVDEKFIAEYIRNPNFKVVKGYSASMPKLPVSEEHIDQIVKYL